jgi:hypothetical protein
MTQNEIPAARGARTGTEGYSSLPCENTSEHNNPNPATQAAKAAFVRELFGESLAIGIEYAAKSLRHVLAADDSAAIDAFRAFRAAAQPAGECARELRPIVEATP